MLYLLNSIETLFQLDVLFMTSSITASYSAEYPLISPVWVQKITQHNISICNSFYDFEYHSIIEVHEVSVD